MLAEWTRNRYAGVKITADGRNVKRMAVWRPEFRRKRKTTVEAVRCSHGRFEEEK